MSITRVLSLCCLLSLGACVEADEEVPPDEITTEAAAWEANPLCGNLVVTETKREPCGLSADLQHILYRTCTRTVTTFRHLEFTTSGTKCVVNSPISSMTTLWQCGPCGG
jgi:hypothetical protein